MPTFFEALRTNPLLLAAVFAGLGASIASGIIGSYVVVKRIVFISGSIAHSVLSGMGLAIYLKRSLDWQWLTPMHGALAAAIISALLIGWIHLNYREREDSIIATIWSTGMAIGVIFISQTPGYNVELNSFLLGNILWVTTQDLITLAALDILIIIFVLLLHKRFLALCFDEEQAQLQGVSVHRLYLLLLILIAITVVLLIQVVGIVLVITMLTLPASIAGTFTNRLSLMMVIGILLNFCFTLAGTAIAFRMDWPTGATIALFSAFIYLLSLRFKK